MTRVCGACVITGNPGGVLSAENGERKSQENIKCCYKNEKEISEKLKNQLAFTLLG